MSEGRGGESYRDVNEKVAAYADVNTDASGGRGDASGAIEDDRGAESDVSGDTDVATAHSRSITAKRQEKSSSGRVD